MSNIDLFLIFVMIGSFSFGGGYAAIPLIQQEIVTNHNIITFSQFSDLIAISSMTPGPIGLNTAIMSGLQTNGFIGAVIATVGLVTPSIIIMGIVGHYYFKYNSSKLLDSLVDGIKPAVTAFIFSSGIVILINAIFGQNIVSLTNVNYLQIFFFILSLFMFIKLKFSPIKGIIIVLFLSLFYQLITSVI